MFELYSIDIPIISPFHHHFCRLTPQLLIVKPSFLLVKPQFGTMNFNTFASAEGTTACTCRPSSVALVVTSTLAIPKLVMGGIPSLGISEDILQKKMERKTIMILVGFKSFIFFWVAVDINMNKVGVSGNRVYSYFCFGKCCRASCLHG